MSGLHWVQLLLDFRDRERELAEANLRLRRVARLLEAEAERPEAFARLARLQAGAVARALEAPGGEARRPLNRP